MGLISLWALISCGCPFVESVCGRGDALKLVVEWMRELGVEDVLFKIDSELVIDSLSPTQWR